MDWDKEKEKLLKEVESQEKVSVETLLKIIKILTGEKGCPWDRKQTPMTLRKYLVEEAYEAYDAISKNNPEEAREELGDLLFLLLFIVWLYEKAKKFTFNELLFYTAQKMIRRHPHVFGDDVAKDSEEVLKKWQQIKKKEGKTSSVLGNLPESLPSLQKAFRLGERASRVGLDWKTPEEVIEKIHEELNELKKAMEEGDHKKIEEEIGDFLFTSANLARKLDVNPEDSLRKALKKFVSRFSKLEELLSQKGLSWEKLSSQELDLLWEEVKKLESQTP